MFGNTFEEPRAHLCHYSFFILTPGWYGNTPKWFPKFRIVIASNIMVHSQRYNYSSSSFMILKREEKRKTTANMSLSFGVGNDINIQFPDI